MYVQNSILASSRDLRWFSYFIPVQRSATMIMNAFEIPYSAKETRYSGRLVYSRGLSSFPELDSLFRNSGVNEVPYLRELLFAQKLILVQSFIYMIINDRLRLDSRPSNFLECKCLTS